MPGKFSFSKLLTHLKHTFWVYLIGFIAVCIFSDMLFDITRPRIGEEERVKIYVLDEYPSAEVFGPMAEDMLLQLQEIDETLRLVEFSAIAYAKADYNSDIVLSARVLGEDGDMYLTNLPALERLLGLNALLPLDDYIAQGFLAGYDVEYHYYQSEYDTQPRIYAVSIDCLTGLDRVGGLNRSGGWLAIGAISTNLETTMEAAELFFRTLGE